MLLTRRKALAGLGGGAAMLAAPLDTSFGWIDHVSEGATVKDVAS